MQIIDNFLTPSYADLIEMQLQSSQQDWYFRRNTIECEKIDPLQHGFCFMFYYDEVWTNSPLTLLLRPFFLQIQETIGAKTILRARADMTVANGAKILHEPHVDLNQKNVTTIYYVSDSDGDTVLYNEKTESEKYTIMNTITPKKNRLVVFDGSHYHTGHSPMNHSNRILINSNYV